MFPHDAPDKNVTLKREVARPPAHDRVFVQLLVLSTLPMLAGMASLWIGVFLGTVPRQVAVEPGPVVQPAVLPSAIAQRAIPPTPLPVALEPGFAFVFELDGASYVHLQDMDAIDLDEGTDEGTDEDSDDVIEDIEADIRPARAPLPRHATPALVRMDGIPFAGVAAVQAGDLPAAIASWQGREVVVDSACRAHVTGFALVARVYSEDLSYDEQEQGLSPGRLARSIFDDMGHLVLAARLDGCKGSYAQPADRPATAPPAAIVARVLASHPAASAAVLALRQSPAGRAAQRTWRENDYEGAWWQDAEVTTQVLQHPRTGETFLSVHALADVECGGVEINLWGMYRVTASGKPEPLVQRALPNVHELETFLDIDGDGRFEILASSLWGMDTFLLRADGSRQAMLHLPYYGCQC